MEVTRFFLLRLTASSKAKRTMRSMPRRVKTEVWMATSSGCMLVDEAADLRVLALGVLADHDEIDVAAFGPGERRLHAGIEVGGTHVGVLIEGAADGQQQAVERGVVGNFGMSDRAEQDGVAGLEQIDRAGRHHAAPAEVVVRAPVEILKGEGDVVLLRARFRERVLPAG